MTIRVEGANQVGVWPLEASRSMRLHVFGFRSFDNTTFQTGHSGENIVPYVIGEEDLIKVSCRENLQFQVGAAGSGTAFTGGFSVVPGTSRWATEQMMPSGTEVFFRSNTGFSGSIMEVERWYA